VQKALPVNIRQNLAFSAAKIDRLIILSSFMHRCKRESARTFNWDTFRNELEVRGQSQLKPVLLG
jgi:hypothetical protein